MSECFTLWVDAVNKHVRKILKVISLQYKFIRKIIPHICFLKLKLLLKLEDLLVTVCCKSCIVLLNIVNNFLLSFAWIYHVLDVLLQYTDFRLYSGLLSCEIFIHTIGRIENTVTNAITRDLAWQGKKRGQVWCWHRSRTFNCSASFEVDFGTHLD